MLDVPGNGRLSMMINAVTWQIVLKDCDIAQFLTNDEDANIFTKCFNSVNNLPTSKFPLRVWKKFKENDDSDDESFQIQCTSVEDYRNNVSLSYIICEVTHDSIIFDTWRVRCNLK